MTALTLTYVMSSYNRKLRMTELFEREETRGGKLQVFVLVLLVQFVDLARDERESRSGGERERETWERERERARCSRDRADERGITRTKMDEKRTRA